MTTLTHHLHIENSSRGFALAHVHPRHVDAARQRHAALANDLHITLGWDGDVLDRVLGTVSCMIASRPPRENLRTLAPRLQWIQTTGAGVDHLLPLDWLPADIVLTNNSGVHGAKCEEFCLMSLLALSHDLPQLIASQQARRWEALYTAPIAGRTCVIIGFGDLGQGAARACRKLGVRVVAVTRSGAASALADVALPHGRLDDALPGADYVIVAAPLTPATRGILGGERLALLKPGAGLINVARAALVDYAALAELLRAGRIGGAVLDVHAPEPLPPDDFVWSMPRTIVTPHVSCDDPRYPDLLLDTWFGNYARLRAGQPLANVVDRVQGY
jgi:phosphoglycerate dehydrogenase-like enzyme